MFLLLHAITKRKSLMRVQHRAQAMHSVKSTRGRPYSEQIESPSSKEICQYVQLVPNLFSIITTPVQRLCTVIVYYSPTCHAHCTSHNSSCLGSAHTRLRVMLRPLYGMTHNVGGEKIQPQHCSKQFHDSVCGYLCRLPMAASTDSWQRLKPWQHSEFKLI